MKITKKQDNNLLTLFTATVWSTRKFDKEFQNTKAVKLPRVIYVLIVIFCSLISVFSLVSPGDSIRQSWETTVSILQLFTFLFFLFDYISHLLTYRKYTEKDTKTPVWKSTLKYIFSWNGIVILICILSSLHTIEILRSEIATNSEFQRTINIFKVLNIFRFIRLFIVLTFFAPFKIIIDVFSKQKKVLSYVLLLVLLVIIIFAILIWNNETIYLENEQKTFINKVFFLDPNNPKKGFVEGYQPENWKIFATYSTLENQVDKDAFIANNNINKDLINIFNNGQNKFILSEYNALSSGYVQNFVDALYFSTITLTTIGYGDFLPHAPLTKIIVSINAIIALAIIAIPSGVIAGAFLNQMQAHIDKKSKKKQEKESKNKEVKND
ncbi:voltage-gated potassium channel [Mycoplasmopsis mustelae]|uniref:Voltage-gated potassium channel n=1 Tax=Mycoplasmopsis mustelae TaxID=171289 RepID=A0A4R7UD80_9BACT|nr:potassium channel family protein [Mycoplasmopsis mustelae]TDV24428.1 voltage-gated potassium channel [Mycoplasmopsis mustelae]